MKLSKRFKQINDSIAPALAYGVKEAVELLRAVSKVKFDETVDLAVNLGIDPRKSDQMVRGSLVLPKGIGKTKRVAVFASAAYADQAVNAGADIVGLEDLAEQIKGGMLDFDVVIANPDAMKVVGQLGQLLGPRGLMPNPKDGTVTQDIATAIANVKAGQIKFRADKGGVIHCPIGKISFAVDDLISNFEAVLMALRKAKPSTAKGVYFKKLTLSSTMGPGLAIKMAAQ